jgi:hypothetical protein
MITDDQFNALLARVNSIDGQNLPDPAQSQLNQLQMGIAGLRTTIRQVTLVLQANLKDLVTQVTNLQLLLNQSKGVS